MSLHRSEEKSAEDQRNAIAYIDAANLHKGVNALGWSLDYKRLRSWMRQKFGVQTAYIFIGMVQKYGSLYTVLKEAGFILIFKEVVFDPSGKIKGNCDADLVLKAARQHFEDRVHSVVLVSNDGDYASLVQFWQEKNIACTILSPSVQNRSSLLLRRTNAPIVYLNDVKRAVCRAPK